MHPRLLHHGCYWWWHFFWQLVQVQTLKLSGRLEFKFFPAWDPGKQGQADGVTMMIFLFHFVQPVLSLVPCPVLFFGSLRFYSLCFSSRVFILFMFSFRSFMSSLVMHVLPDTPVTVLKGLSSVVLSWLPVSVPNFFLLFSVSHFQLLCHFHLCLTCGPLPSCIKSLPPFVCIQVVVLSDLWKSLL